MFGEEKKLFLHFRYFMHRIKSCFVVQLRTKFSGFVHFLCYVWMFKEIRKREIVNREIKEREIREKWSRNSALFG
jgi:hypothetical protein